MATEKTRLRQHFRTLRQNIAATERSIAAGKAAEILLRQPNFIASKNIACYLASATEFDVAPIIAAIWHAQKNCYVPLIQPDLSLHFVRYDEGAALKPNRFGIFEPVDTHLDIPFAELDLVLLPLLAFDRRGQRLGTGGGYYDRTFADELTPPLIGVGYAAQEAPALPVDPWDVRLSAVLTEQEYINI